VKTPYVTDAHCGFFWAQSTQVLLVPCACIARSFAPAIDDAINLSQKLLCYTKETTTTTTTTAAASSKQASSLPAAGAPPQKMVTVGRENRSRDQFVS
jgi:hypothetical protein